MNFLAKMKRPGWIQRAAAVRLQQHHKFGSISKAQPSKFFPTPGLPPHLGLVGSDTLTALHHYHWAKETTMAAHFLPERHTQMINGRPMQASMLF